MNYHLMNYHGSTNCCVTKGSTHSLSALHQNFWAVMTMTTKNPILDELHAVREQMLADAGGTLAGLVAKIQSDQAKSGRVIIKSSDNVSSDNTALNRSRELPR